MDSFLPALLVLFITVLSFELSTLGALRKYDAKCFEFLNLDISITSAIIAMAVNTETPVMLVRISI